MAAPKKRRIPISIDMTPMVDIAFLLLIFFMSTTVFKKPAEVDVQAPSSHSIRPLPETGIIVITIPKDNRVFMTLDNAALDVENGLAEVKGLTTRGIEFQPDSIVKPIERLMLKRLVDKVVLKADKDASYGTIEKVLQTLQKNELLFVNMVTEVEES
ncbi:biopolymer transporter ExbD [bacterium]|nr:biopolymer transporter ExbD [bacterium]